MRIGFDVSPLARPHPLGVERATRELVAALERRGRLDVVRLAPPAGMHLVRWRQLELPRACKPLGLAGLHSPVSAFSWFARVPRVQTIHELPWRHGADENADARHRFWARRGARRADAVLVPSEHVARDLRAETPAAAGKLHVVPWAPSTCFARTPSAEDTAAVRAEFTRPFVVCAGGARPKKAAENVLAALHELAREQRYDGDLVITGVRADERAAARARLADVRVRFTDVLTDERLAALYRAATAVVVIARSEGFGFPVIEALACGTPAIVRNGSAQAELAGGAGIAVDADDAAALGHAILRARDERAAWSLAGSRRAAEFSWDASAARVETLWRELGA
jgi:glycosyltransferase involved in cell wall biosynthesis